MQLDGALTQDLMMGAGLMRWGALWGRSEDAIIVDVRDQAEYAQGHIPDARHIPLGELARRSAELDAFKTRPLILCCASGARSATAMTQLARAGFERLYNLHGGLIEWQKAGHPVRRSKKK